jgi:hypothetical protein
VDILSNAVADLKNVRVGEYSGFDSGEWKKGDEV